VKKEIVQLFSSPVHFHSLFYRSACSKNINNSKAHPLIWLLVIKLPNYFILFLNKSNRNTEVYLNGFLTGWKVTFNKSDVAIGHPPKVRKDSPKVRKDSFGESLDLRRVIDLRTEASGRYDIKNLRASPCSRCLRGLSS
jgi:hypothetical protein